MTSKSSCIGVTAGIIAGVVIGGAIGIAVKKIMKPKSAMGKTFSAALGAVGDMFSNMAKYTS